MIDSIDLGLVKAIHKGLTAPTNTDMLWYDDNLGVKKHKYYDTVLSAWTALAPPSGVTGSGTLGYLPKWSATSVIEDSSIYQTGSGRIGIGTINPLSNLTVSGNNSSAVIVSQRYSNDVNAPGFGGMKARGTESSPSQVLSGDLLLTIGAFGYTSGGAFSDGVGKMVFYATEDFTGSANGTAFKISTTPIGATVDVFNFGINEDGYVSMGDVNLSPTARLHVTGKSATSLDYALKVDNLAGSPLLYVRNDQSVTMNNSVTWGKLSGFDYLWIGQGSSNLSTNYSLAYNTGYLILNSTSALPILVRRENSDGSGLVPMMDFGNSSIPNIIKLNDMYGVGISTSKLLLNTDGLGSVQMGIFNGTTVTGKFIFNNQDTTAGFGILNPSATAHIQGVNSTSANYALKVDNSAASPLLYVRNDGLISAALLQTGNAGLTTGDMYVDTAANILANGDKVVGWKV